MDEVKDHPRRYVCMPWPQLTGNGACAGQSTTLRDRRIHPARLHAHARARLVVEMYSVTFKHKTNPNPNANSYS